MKRLSEFFHKLLSVKFLFVVVATTLYAFNTESMNNFWLMAASWGMWIGFREVSKIINLIKQVKTQ